MVEEPQHTMDLAILWSCIDLERKCLIVKKCRHSFSTPADENWLSQSQTYLLYSSNTIDKSLGKPTESYFVMYFHKYKLTRTSSSTIILTTSQTILSFKLCGSLNFCNDISSKFATSQILTLLVVQWCFVHATGRKRTNTWSRFNQWYMLSELLRSRRCSLSNVDDGFWPRRRDCSL